MLWTPIKIPIIRMFWQLIFKLSSLQKYSMFWFTDVLEKELGHPGLNLQCSVHKILLYILILLLTIRMF